jgi:hypothetical protein
MKLLIAGFLMAAWADAQTLEIRGKVVEGAVGLGGATVTLYEFGHTPPEATTRSVFAVTFTDATGKFTFHPARAGEYYVEVKKDGYFAESFDGPTVDPIDNIGHPVSIDKDHPAQEQRFTMMRLGELRGRVIDEDGKPMAKLRVGLRPATSTQVVTDQDGYFTATKLRPGDYLVSVRRRGPEILPQFSADDLKIVDQDLENSTWPSIPVPISSGTFLSVGTITAHKTKYYRAHLTVLPGDCAQGERWSFWATPVSDTPSFVVPLPVPCGSEFLVRNLAPGSYSFALSTSERVGEQKRWAVAPVEISDRNLEIALTMSLGVDISGRLVGAEGVTLPLPSNVVIDVTPVSAAVSAHQLAAVDPDGKFLIRGLRGDRHRVLVDGLDDKFFVKELRYSGLAVIDGIITPMAGSQAVLEIVIDDKAATISGSVTARDKPVGMVLVVAVKWPVPPEDTRQSTVMSAMTGDQGNFQIRGLAPGEYRVLALRQDVFLRVKDDRFFQLLSSADKVTVERGSSQSVALKMIEP